MAHEDRPNYIDAVVTCKGNLHDPDFSTKFQIIVDKLKSLLSPNKKEDDILRVRKIEPWNSVKVTISIPKEAAERLKQLAEQGSHVLRQLGILSVQVEGDQVISLTLAGSGSEPTHVTLQHGSEQSFPSGSSSTAGNYLVSGISNPSFLQKQTPSTSTVPFAVAGPSGVRYPIDVRNSVAAQPSPFRSPNVVAPTGESLPFSQRGPPTPGPGPGPGIPPRIPLAGPFPFASMVHAAAHSVQRGDTNSTSDDNANSRDKVHVGNAYVLGKSAIVQNTASQQLHAVQQSTPVSGVLLTSQSGVAESGGTKFVFSSNSQSSANNANAISQANSLVLPATSSAVQPGANSSLQIQLVNVNNSSLPPPPYPYQQKQQQQPLHQAASQIAAVPSDKPMSSPLLVNLLQHGDTNTNSNSGGLVPNAASSPRLQSPSLSKSQVQMSMPPPQTVASMASIDGQQQQQQYFRRPVQTQDQRPQRSLSLDSTNSEPNANAFHDLNFTASQSLSAITYSTSSNSPLTNSNSNEQFQFAMPLPCDVPSNPSSSRNNAEQQQLRTSTITHNQNSSQNSTPYRAMNPTEVVAYHQHNQLQQPTIRMQQQQQTLQTGLDQSSYQKMQQQFAPAPTTESVQLQNQQQQARSHMFNGPVSSPQQYSSPQTIAQSNAPSFVVNTSDNSMMPITSVSGQSQQAFAVSSSPAGSTGHRFYGPTTQANIATAVHVTKIPVQQAHAMSTALTDQQQIHSFIPISAVNVTSVSNPAVSNASASAIHASGNNSQGQAPLSAPASADSVFAFPQPMPPKPEAGKGKGAQVQSAEATTKNVASHSPKGSNNKSAATGLVPSIPTSVTSIRPRGRPPGPRTVAGHGPGSAGGGKPRLLLINPLTGQLEPTATAAQNEGGGSSGSSESEDDKIGKAGSKAFTGKRGLGKGKPAEALASGMTSVLGKQQPATISEQAKELQRQILLLQQQEQLLLQQQHRLHQPSTPSTASTSHGHGAATTSSTLGGRKLSSDDPLSGSSGEKIKLRLKLEKNEPVLSPAYKVNVSFLKTEEKAGSSASGAASSASSFASSAASTSNSTSSQPSQGNVVTDQPRVPPLHISLRGKNAAVVVSPRRDDREHSDTLEPNATPASVADAKPAGVGVNCVDAVVAAVSGVTNVKNRMKNRPKSTDVLSSQSQSKGRTPRPKNANANANANAPRNVVNKSVPGKIRAKKSSSFSTGNVKADMIAGEQPEPDWDSQPKKTKTSRRKSELSDAKPAASVHVNANAVEKESTSTSKAHPEISKHDRLDGLLDSNLTPKMEESQLLQLLSDNVTPAADELSTSTDKNDSTNAVTKARSTDVEKSEVGQVPLISAKVEVAAPTKKTEPASRPVDLPPATENVNVNAGPAKTDDKKSIVSQKPEVKAKVISEISQPQIVDKKAKDGKPGGTTGTAGMKPQKDETPVPAGAEPKALKREYTPSQVAVKAQNCAKTDAESSPPAKLYKPATTMKAEIPEIFPELSSHSVAVALSEGTQLPVSLDTKDKILGNLELDAKEKKDGPLIRDKKATDISIVAEKDAVVDMDIALPHRTNLSEKKSLSGSESGSESEVVQLSTIPNFLSKSDLKESKDAAYEEVFKEESVQAAKAPAVELLQNKAAPAAATSAAAAAAASTSSSQAFSRQVPVAVKPVAEPSNGNGNGHSGGGEDSGIDSMDALSEKSPNQGESPVRKELEQHLVNSDRVHQYLPTLPSSAPHPNEPEKYYDRLRSEPEREPAVEGGMVEASTSGVKAEERAPTPMEIEPPAVEEPSLPAPVVETPEPMAIDAGKQEVEEKESNCSSQQNENLQAVEVEPQPTSNTSEVHTGEISEVALPTEFDSSKEELTDASADDMLESEKKEVTTPTIQAEPSSRAEEEEQQTPEQVISGPTSPAIPREAMDENKRPDIEEKSEEPAVMVEPEKAAEPEPIQESEPSQPVFKEVAPAKREELEPLKLDKNEGAEKTSASASELVGIKTEDKNTMEATETVETGDLPQLECKPKADLAEDQMSTKEQKPTASSEPRKEMLVAENTTSEVKEAEVVAAAPPVPVAKPEASSPTPKVEAIQETKKVEAPAVVPVEQGIMPPSEIVAMVQNLKEALKEETAADSSKEKQKQGSEPTTPTASMEKPVILEEAPKAGVGTTPAAAAAPSTTTAATEPKITKSTSTNVTELQPGSIPVSFLPRIEHSAIRQRPLLRPHVQNPGAPAAILLRPKLIDSTTRIAVGVRPDLKSLPRLQPKPEDRVNHEPIQVFPVQTQPSSEAADSESAQPNIDFQSLPLSFSRAGGLTSLPNVIHLTRAPSGSITSMQSKVPSSLIATSATGGMVSVSLPQVAQAGKTNPPRIFALHSNSGTMLPQQIQQQQQTVTLPSGHKVVPIKLVAFPRHTQGALGSFVGTPLNRSSPTLLEAVKTSAFRNVSSSSPVHSSPQSISAVQVGVPGSGNITLVPISAVTTNVTSMPGQHNPVKLIVSSPLKVQPNLRQPVVMKSVVMGTPPPNTSIPRGATTIKVLTTGPSAVNHVGVGEGSKSPSPSPTPNPAPIASEQGQAPAKKAETNSEEMQKPEPMKAKAKSPPVTEKVEKDPETSVKSRESQSPQKPAPGGGASIYKGIHGVQLLGTSSPDTKNQDFQIQADIIHDEKDLAAILAGESICIEENGIEDAGSSAYDFTHNDYDVLPPQPIKAAIRQAAATDTKTTTTGKIEVAAVPVNANDEDELEPSPPAATPNSPVRVLRSNSPLYTYSSNRASSARNSDHSRESSRSPSPNPEAEVDDDDQEIIDSFSSSASPKSFDTEPDACRMESKFPDHSYNQKEAIPDGNGELGPLSINIPGADDVNSEEGKGKRSTRSNARAPSPDIITAYDTRKVSKKTDIVFKNSPKASPTGSVKLLSPTIGGGSGASSARASPISNSASSTASSSTRVIASGRGPNKRKRQESDSSSASKDEIVSTEDKMELIDLNSRPGKRRCSENAAELIKACIGIEDTPKRVNSFSRKLEDTKARDRIRKNTPTILEQNESETDSIDFSLTGKSASRGSSEDRSSSRGSSVQRGSNKSIFRDEDSLDKLIKKKDLPRNKLKAQPQSRSESPNVAEQTEEESSKARRSKRATPAKSQNALGTKRARNANAKEQSQLAPELSDSTPAGGPRNEKRKTRSSAANRL